MTGSPPNDSLEKITVLDVVPAVNSDGMVTFVLGEQLCCLGCGRISTRWQIPGPAVPAVPEPQKPTKFQSEPGS